MAMSTEDIESGHKLWDAVLVSGVFIRECGQQEPFFSVGLQRQEDHAKWNQWGELPDTGQQGCAQEHAKQPRVNGMARDPIRPISSKLVILFHDRGKGPHRAECKSRPQAEDGRGNQNHEAEHTHPDRLYEYQALPKPSAQDGQYRTHNNDAEERHGAAEVVCSLMRPPDRVVYAADRPNEYTSAPARRDWDADGEGAHSLDYPRLGGRSDG